MYSAAARETPDNSDNTPQAEQVVLQRKTVLFGIEAIIRRATFTVWDLNMVVVYIFAREWFI